MIIDSTTDPTQFAGTHVTIDHVRTARILDIRHGRDAVHCIDALRDGV